MERRIVINSTVNDTLVSWSKKKMNVKRITSKKLLKHAKITPFCDIAF